MSTDATKKTLLEAAVAIRAAQQIVLQASREASDALAAIRLNTEYQHLDSMLQQVLRTQAIDDDDDFEAAASVLKQQSSSLEAEKGHIDTIVKDVETAAKVSGYIVQAATLLAGI